MKILHLVPYFSPDIGGMQTFSAQLIASLQERGYKNYVFTSRKTAELPDVTDFHGAVVQRVNFMNAIHTANLRDVLLAKKQLEKIKRSFSPDVTVVHLGAPIAFLQLATAKIIPTPVVVVSYEVSPAGESSPTLRQLFEQASHTVAISQVRLEDSRFIAPDAADRMSLIYASRPWREFLPSVGSSPTPMVLMTARLISMKGFDLAVDAFKHVHEEMPEARLVLVGEGPFQNELDRQIKRLGLQDFVKLLGYLPDAELSRLYQQAWVTLVPSRHSESFGLVALEAMQAACPVIASRVGGLAEVVVDGETGFLIPPDDPSALANAVLKLLRDRPLGIQMGEAGLSRARKFFNWENCVSEYEAVFRRVTRG